MNPAKKPSTILASLLSLALAGTSCHGALSAFSQDFEGLSKTDPNALANDGWFVFGNVFDGGTGGYLYGYGPFTAPNGGPAFSVISDLPSGGNPPAGAQGLVVYSDYNNGDHGNGHLIEANVFQEQLVDAADIGSIWRLSFIASPDNLAPPSTAAGFIKTFDAGGNFLNLFSADTTTLAPGNTPFTVDVAIEPAVAKVQFGFLNTATNYNDSGVNYDNVGFNLIPEPSMLPLLSLSALAVLRRRR